MENGRLGNLKKTQGNNLVFLKKRSLFLAVWSWGSSGKPVTRPETQTLLFVLTNQVRAAAGCLQVNKATIMWCKYHTARFLLQIGSQIIFLWVSVKGRWWSPSWMGRFSSLQMFRRCSQRLKVQLWLQRDVRSLGRFPSGLVSFLVSVVVVVEVLPA